MSRKRPPVPPKSKPFATAPFARLKGVSVTGGPAVPPAQAVSPSPPLPGEDDRDLFRQAMTGVRRLDQPDRQHGSTGDPSAQTPLSGKNATAPSPEPRGDAADNLFLREIERLKLEVRFSDELPEADELKPLAGNRLRQVKRGIITVDHQLDLHGLTRAEALEALPRFLAAARRRGQAAVLVITGKGNNSPGEPVLQQAVSSWLRESGREMVTEFAPAPREMGGNGALVLFLRPAAPQVRQNRT